MKNKPTSRGRHVEGFGQAAKTGAFHPQALERFRWCVFLIFAPPWMARFPPNAELSEPPPPSSESSGDPLVAPTI
jgi:hypothetical protein